MWPNPQVPPVLHGKLHFLCSVYIQSYSKHFESELHLYILQKQKLVQIRIKIFSE